MREIQDVACCMVDLKGFPETYASNVWLGNFSHECFNQLHDLLEAVLFKQRCLSSLYASGQEKPVALRIDAVPLAGRR